MTLIVNCIGLGHWGPNLVRNLNALPDCRIGIVCDKAQARVDAFDRSEVPSDVTFTTDSDCAATDANSDAVFIATPVATHFELAKKALWAGKHVFVEKPICLSSVEARSLVELAATRNKQLAVGHVFLFNPAVRAVKRLIESGQLGRLQYLTATRTNHGPRRTDVNALWDLGSHDLSLFQYWLNADPDAVTASGSLCHDSNLADVVSANFYYGERLVAHVQANWLSPHKTREITIAGTEHTVVWSDTPGATPLRIYQSNSKLDGRLLSRISVCDLVSQEQAQSEPLAAECQHFLDVILRHTHLLNDGRSASRIVSALEAADRSMRECSGLINVEYDQERVEFVSSATSVVDRHAA